MSKKSSQQTLSELSYLFRVMFNEAKVWGSGKEVCVGWQHSNGFMRWYEEDGEVKFQYICTDDSV